MRTLILCLVLISACGANDHAKVTAVPVPAFDPSATTQLAATITDDSPAAVFGTTGQPMSSCGSDSDCAGFGKCSSGSCGHCGSDSDCNGNGKCSNSMCGHCGSDSDCKTGKCSNSKCGSCGSDSDCSIGKCSNSKCGHCGSDSDCKGGKCSNSKCSNYTN